jgi:hypothetical protein
MPMNKYDLINQPLSEEFTKLLVDLAKMAEDKAEEKIMILMVREIWNISYFDPKAQQQELEEFVTSLGVDREQHDKYRSLMADGIIKKKNATKNIDIPEVWTRIENLKVRKIKGHYAVEFEFDFYE